MKIIPIMITTLTLLTSSLSAEAHSESKCKSRDEVYCQIKKNSPRLDERYSRKLSAAIRRASKLHKVPRRILTAILFQESSYRLGVVRKECGLVKSRVGRYKRGCVSQDFGIAQISHRTVKGYRFDVERLTMDLSYSVNAGAEVLSWFYRTYAQRDPDSWYTRYNCGTRGKTTRGTCARYKRLVGRWE